MLQKFFGITSFLIPFLPNFTEIKAVNLTVKREITYIYRNNLLLI